MYIFSVEGEFWVYLGKLGIFLQHHPPQSGPHRATLRALVSLNMIASNFFEHRLLLKATSN